MSKNPDKKGGAPPPGNKGKAVPKKGGKPGEEGDDEEEKEQEPGCCDKFASCLIFTFKWIYRILALIINTILTILGFIWYPIKERCCFCIDRIDKKLNPYKDESYTNV